MMEQILQFLEALDQALQEVAAKNERLDLYHLGRSALILHHNLKMPPGGTQDFDVVQVSYPPPSLLQKALVLFGKNTTKAKEHGLYLEAVPSGAPPLPGWFDRRSREVPGPWKVVRLWQLEVHDLAVSKLKSFRAHDRQDLQFLCDEAGLDPSKLIASLESAFRWTTDKDGDPDRERAFANLRRVIDYLEGRSRTI